jgi:hypothetical protein
LGPEEVRKMGKKVKKAKAEVSRRIVSADRVAERESEGWRVVAGETALRNGSVVMEKAEK